MDRFITIENGTTKITIDRIGAAITSWVVGGVEIIYNGANYTKPQWDGNAKNLFPNPGPTGKTNPVYGALDEYLVNYNGFVKKYTEYIHNGFGYLMPQHGTAQFSEFNVQGLEKHRCLLSINQYNEKMSSLYPYFFKYGIDYTINKDGGLEYFAFAKNNDKKEMLAGMGWHPGFILHANADKYKIVIKNLIADDNCLLEEGVEYDVNEIINSKNPVFFQGIESADVILMYEKEGGKKIPYLKMHTNEPNLIFWSKPKTSEGQDDFICIEPWNTTPGQISKLTTQDKTKSLGEGNDPAVIIKPGKEKTMKVVVEVNEDYIKEIESSTKARGNDRVAEKEDDFIR